MKQKVIEKLERKCECKRKIEKIIKTTKFEIRTK